MENLIKVFEKVRDKAGKKFIEEKIKFKESGKHHVYSFCSLWIFMDGRKKLTKDIVNACNEIDGISITRTGSGIYDFVIKDCHFPGEIAKIGCKIAEDILSEEIGIKVYVNHRLD